MKSSAPDQPWSTKSHWVCGVLAILVAVAASTRPLIKGFDESLYLSAADGFLANGFRFAYAREPGYPMFLAGMKFAGVDPLIYAPLIQNAFFVGALYLFLRTVFHRWLARSGALFMAACITLIPTFSIVCNGALYAETLLASLVLILLSAFHRLARSASTRSLEVGVCLLMIGLSSAWLALTKGSFGFIHVVFCLLGLGWLAVDRFVAGKEVSGRNRTLLGLGLIVCVLASNMAVRIYLNHQSGLAGRPISLFYRGGAIFYGRTQYARNFDFSLDSPKYLLAALSKSAYQRVYNDDGSRWNFEAENLPGLTLLASNEKTDAQLFDMGLQTMSETPLRQFAFGFFEWAQFIMHHTSSGFAECRLPVIGSIVNSNAAAFAMKIFTIALYLGPPVAFWRRRKEPRPWRIWEEWPEDIQRGTVLALLYAVAFLSIHFMASTVVRMVWPIAPFWVIFNWQLIVGAKIRKSFSAGRTAN